MIERAPGARHVEVQAVGADDMGVDCSMVRDHPEKRVGREETLLEPGGTGLVVTDVEENGHRAPFRLGHSPPLPRLRTTRPFP